MPPMCVMVKRFLADRSGATAVEYGLLVGVLSLTIMAGVGSVGNSLENFWIRIGTILDASWN
jgi:pilus assembly protein Flp/PilA